MTATEYQIRRAITDIELQRASVGPGRVIGTHVLDMLARLNDIGVTDFRTLAIKVEQRPIALCVSASVVTDDGD